MLVLIFADAAAVYLHQSVCEPAGLPPHENVDIKGQGPEKSQTIQFCKAEMAVDSATRHQVAAVPAVSEPTRQAKIRPCYRRAPIPAQRLAGLD